MQAKLTIALGILLVGGCTTTEQAGEFSSPSHSRVGEHDSIALQGTAEWRESRSRVLRTFAFRALEQGLIEEARTYLQEACDTNPSDTKSHAAFCRLLMTEGQIQTAIAYGRQATEYAPEDPEINLVLAAALAENDQTAEASRILEHLWDVEPGNPAFARALLTHYSDTQGDAVAQRFVEKILEESPNQAQSWSMAGDVYLAEGRFDDAAEAYRRALEHDPSIPVPPSLADQLGIKSKHENPMIASAQAAEEARDLEAAERLYRFLAKNKPEDREINAGLARTLYRMERSEEAIHALQAIPGEHWTWREHLLEAKIHIARQEWPAARQSLVVTRDLRPGTEVVGLLLQAVDQKIEAAKSAAKNPAKQSVLAPVEAPAPAEELDKNTSVDVPIPIRMDKKEKEEEEGGQQEDDGEEGSE